VDSIVASKKVTYGINTGFGLFESTVIDEDKLSQLQTNLIRSHAVGVGEPISRQLTRMVCILRVNALSKGFSGISSATLRALIKMLNANTLPRIPIQGNSG
jgi:histidine ammonia-lyase